MERGCHKRRGRQPSVVATGEKRHDCYDNFLTIWDAMQPYVDRQRFDEVQRKLRIQARDAEWWRDACLLYFQTFSHRPISQDMEHPVHNLDEMMQFVIPISMYENPAYGYTK